MRLGCWISKYLSYCWGFVSLGSMATVARATISPRAPGNTGVVYVTPHDMYSSSVGVLGCKINTNRVAYWPVPVSCDDICVEVSYEGRKLQLLQIDQSERAYDVSYDAWNYLSFGKPATEEPHEGGGFLMTYEVVHPSTCHHLLNDGKLPLSAANSMNYVASCLVNQPGSWVAQNYVLYNILDPVCHYGVDEECRLDLTLSNQPQCPSMLGINTLVGLRVENIIYGTGEKKEAP